MTYKSKVVIVQPYVPSYRVSFFTKLSSKLAMQELECKVIAGMPKGQQAKRGDAVKPEWMHPLNQKTRTFHGRAISLPSYPVPWRGADAVILGLEGTSPLVYQAIIERTRKATRVGLWGHVRPYVNSGNSIDLMLERKQMDCADRIFAYTPGGKSYAVDKGIKSEKVTTVMNTVDTSALEKIINGDSRTISAKFKARYNLRTHETICFIGGLDASKRIDFLAASLDHLWKLNSQIKLLVAGRGVEENKLHKAYARQQAIPMGHVNVETKAEILLASSAICMPGRIGLVAVDALIARKPIITTPWPFHAPESEYLREGESRITAADDPSQYALSVVAYLDKKSRQLGTIDHKQSAWAYPTLDQMVDNYAAGIEAMMQ